MAISVSSNFANNMGSGDPAVGLDCITAFDQWALARGMRGKDIFDTIAKVMQYWVSFAMSKVPKGDAGKIRRHLETLTTSYSRIGSGDRAKLRGSRTSNRLRGTIASAIVHILNYKGARLKAAFGDDAGYYATVNQYINARAYSANMYRGGFMPAINVLGRGKGADPGNSGQIRAPKYRHPTGSIAHSFTDQLASILVENFAAQSDNHPFRSKSSTIETLAGDAFDKGLVQVIEMVGSFLKNDMEKAAAASGFTVTPAPITMMKAPSISLAA